MRYDEYLEVDALLKLQNGRSDGPEHDEMLFIIIHQVYELWFKQVLHEVDYLQGLLLADDTSRALHTLRRILTILKTMVAQVDILETMTPQEFLSFRGYLDTASGFQSAQFRELEFALGHKRPNMMRYHEENPTVHGRLTNRYNAPTLWDAFLHLLAQHGYDIPADQLERDVTQSIQANEAVQEALLKLYRDNSPLGRLCERLVDLDEGIQEWRYRHVKMVERTIGRKQGTGGSCGADYLRHTLFHPLFPDLWDIRGKL